MSIVPMSHLSADDLTLLGNNVRPVRRRRRVNPDQRRRRRVLAAVNRSLAALHERVDRFYRGPARAAAER